MINIRPVSDLRNKYPEIEKLVLSSQAPVFLTKNGCGAMVVMSMEQYSALTETLDAKLAEADAYAQEHDLRLTAEEVFSEARGRICE